MVSTLNERSPVKETENVLTAGEREQLETQIEELTG